MEWVLENTNEIDTNALNVNAKGFCVFRVCAGKKNCAKYQCIVLLT